ncbi:HAD-IA family hydrolase [Priestia megaterium]|nr:HAD-IA family hydrolase [Priestia megaterium]MED4797683.1 HAD-IA family hydrolase [Priestia megaterium]
MIGMALFELANTRGVASYKATQVKSEEGIYKLLIERYTIKPEESIFIDDSEANIEAAKKLNFNTIHLKNPKDLREKLKHIILNFRGVLWQKKSKLSFQKYQPI